MTSTRLLIAAPIPDPASWLVTAELPAGYMILRSLTIAPRGESRDSVQTHVQAKAGKTPGAALVRGEDIALPSQLERLLQAFARCDASGRAEVLKIAEVLAGAA